MCIRDSNYSNRVFNGAIYIAEHDDDPDHLMSYLSNIYAEDFQPGELSNYEPVNNAKLEKQAVKAGVSENVAAAAFSGKNEYLDWLTASNNYTCLLYTSQPVCRMISATSSSPDMPHTYLGVPRPKSAAASEVAKKSMNLSLIHI